MPEVIGWPGSGQRLSRNVLILVGKGDPNSSATVDVQNAGVGSLYLRTDGPDTTHCLYVCTTAGIPKTVTANGVPATWTAK
jgi:hypothetical protein